MKYQLSETEYHNLIGIGEHEEICEKFRQRIRNTKSAINIMQAKLKLAGENEIITPANSGSVLCDIAEKAISIIFSLVKKHGGEFGHEESKLVEFPLGYYSDMNYIVQVKLGRIDCKERVILDEEGNELEFDTLTTDSVVKLAVYLEAYYRDK